MEVQQLSLAALSAACQEETTKFLRREPAEEAPCWEIMRRAVCERDQDAWEALYAQYRGMVLGWIRQHPAAAMMDEDDDHWVGRTFERFWNSVGPERFALFAGLAHVLKYLKLCAHSTLMDEARQRRRAPAASLEDESLRSQVAAAGEVSDAEAVAVDQVAANNLWQAVLAEAKSDQEQLVAHLSLVLHLKPREIFARHPDQFATIDDVYRITANLKERLRRSPTIRQYLDRDVA
jgi:DNA-directed RNA polymerase specialized sigma24 family protein